MMDDRYDGFVLFVKVSECVEKNYELVCWMKELLSKRLALGRIFIPKPR
jgi:hypothetical protein